MGVRSELKIVKTDDNSCTLYLPELDEHYHSHKGAVRESAHVFINAGLNKALDYFSEIKIVEIGFGTGLNALLSLELIKKKPNCSIYYNAYDKYPLDIKLVSKLNYTQIVGIEEKWFRKIHEAEWEHPISLGGNFIIIKRRQDLVDNLNFKPCNLVYFDAFAPQKQPEMWSYEIFDELYRHMDTSGILVTYSAMGEVRRKLSSVGFKVERLPGPPGKREMLRAIK